MTAGHLKAELEKWSVAYKEFVEGFDTVTKFWSLTSLDRKEEGRKKLLIFKEDLKRTLCDKLVHLIYHITVWNIWAKKPLTLSK